MTAPASAYPRTVEDLLPRARELAAQLGEIPSRNALMREFSIGGPKAGRLLDALSLPTDLDTPPVAPQPETLPAVATQPLVTVDGPPDTASEASEAEAPSKTARPVRSWPVFLIALPAAVAIWSGWVGLGGLTGFGPVNLLPGIVEAGDWATINSAITLPIGVEAYAAYALKAWLSGSRVPVKARRFARWSAIASLVVGSAGQVAYHLMESAGMTSAPWWITTAVACLPVAVLGMGAALAHLLNSEDEDQAGA